MPSRRSQFVVFTLSLILAAEFARADDLFPTMREPAEVTVSLGKHEVILPSGTGGLTHFPDEPLCILQQKPLTFTLVAADSTYLMQGRTLAGAQPLGKILSPGPAGSVDNNYAGISAMYHDKPTKRWLGLYHAEDKEGIGTIEVTGVQGFYGTICGVEMSEDGKFVKKLGPVITADKPKLPRGWETEGGPKEAWLAQGVGVPSVCVTGDGKDFLCCYTEWSNRLKRGVQICAARCPIDDIAQANPWKKYHNGQFREPGLGGHETPVITAGARADTYDAHVQWVEKWQRYVLVFGCGLHSEVLSKPPKAIESGLFVTTSKDGVTWAKPVRIETVFPLVIVTQPCKVHPTLMISSVSEKKLTGRLVYGWTPEWPRETHCMGGRVVTLGLGGKGAAPAKSK